MSEQSAPPLEPVADDLDGAILAAIRLQPMSRRQLAGALSATPSAIGLAIARLTAAGRVTENGGAVGLPGSLPDLRGGDQFADQARALWQRRGVLVVYPVDVPDSPLREKLMMLGNALYGRRRRLG